MFDHRNGSLHAALLIGFAALAGLSGPALAQSQVAPFHALSGIQYAQASSTVMEVQRELNQLGYNAGTADGLMGARTRSAIQAYQRDSNLRVDGQATSSLLSHVRGTARSGAPAAPAPVAEPQSQQIANIQNTLRSLGYRIERPTGRLTDETRSAIRKYEADNGLLMSGEPSTELLRHMRQRADAGSGAGSAAPAPAADANTVARIQTELRVRGYPIPTISGQMDTQTRQAISEYQQGQGVAVTGEPSTALLAELRAASAEPAPAAEEYTRAQRAAAQRTLNERGFDAGPPDGVLGPRSRIAIRNFQARNNIDPTGELGARTMELLGVSVGAAVAEEPEAANDGYQTRVRDNFKDGDYTRNPAWRVVSGNFEVRNGGLRSVVNAPSQRSDDVGRRMINDLLKERLGVNVGGGEESAAAAHLPTRITPQFRITVALSGVAAANSHIDLGPYQGDRLNHGYRLIYRADQPGTLHLVFADQNGTTSIGSGRFQIDRGGQQKLVWQRDPDGRMTVSRNGRVLIDVVDRKLNTDAAGFSLINAGGDWTLHQVIVEDRG